MTLIKAIAELYNHSNKKQIAQFMINIDEESHTISVLKYWDSDTENWEYSVKSRYEPAIKYTEAGIISGIISASDKISTYSNELPYTLSQILYHVK